MNESGGVFDYAAVRQRRLELYPAPVYSATEAQKSGGSIWHCDVCPKAIGEHCGESCSLVRDNLSRSDGVIVS